MKDYLLFSGSSNTALADEIAGILNIQLGKVDLTRFADGEIRPWIQEDVRDKVVFVLESLSSPMDEYVMELSLMGDAIRRSAPSNMIAIVPYMGYARQDKQHRVGEPVSARVIAKFLEVSKFRELITVDLHNDAVVGFFQIPVINATAIHVLADAVKKKGISNAVVVSPDVGGVKRARNLSYILDIPLVVMEKKRFLDQQDKSESYQIIGDVSGKTAIIIDDIISTGGTIVNGTQSLKDAGATKIIVCATHGVMAGEAKKKLSGSVADDIIITNSISTPVEKSFDKLSTVSIAPLLADAIRDIVR